jgi:hypothetical protein
MRDLLKKDMQFGNRMDEISNTTKMEYIKSIIILRSLAINFILENQDNLALLKEYWHDVELFAVKDKTVDGLPMVRNGVLGELAAITIFKKISHKSRAGSSREDALKGVDLWIDNTRVAQVTTWVSENPIIFYQDRAIYDFDLDKISDKMSKKFNSLQEKYRICHASLWFYG